MKYLLVSPRIAIQKSDFLGSGVPYWPIELATLASFLRDSGSEVTVIDLFGSAPQSLEDRGDYYLQGQSFETAFTDGCMDGVDAVIVYALSYMSHGDLLGILEFLKGRFPNLIRLVLENSQAVTSYSLSHVADALMGAGAHFLICGEPYWNWDEIVSAIQNPDSPPPTNLISRKSEVPYRVYRRVNKNPSFPIPSWELFPIKNYWRLPYSHGPKTKTFFPILTSRGCPYPCDFCVVPETNQRRWRARSAEEVVNEMVALSQRFGVKDFQIEDLNPTVKSSRIDEICELLLKRDAKIHFYLVSGTKAETVPLQSIPLWAKAGCRYISISPESGSERVMREIGKPFNYQHGIDLVQTCNEHGIYTQACFVVGHPSEDEQDFGRSEHYLRELVRNRLDEVAVFIVSPFAGSKLYQQNRITLASGSTFVSFSPIHREDYEILAQRRRRLISLFFAEKLKRGSDLWLQGIRALFGIPATKMENLPKRILYTLALALWCRFNRLRRLWCFTSRSASAVRIGGSSAN